MIGFVLKVGNPYGPHDQRRYNGNKKDGVLARPKIVLETQGSPYKESPCNMATTNVGVSIGVSLGMVVIRFKRRALRYERMLGWALSKETARCVELASRDRVTIG